MKRVMLTVAYDGTDYCGWQVQPNGVTIEQRLNEALSRLLGEDIHVSGASRTDSGVHAMCNLAVFDTENPMDPGRISFAVNTYLPPDIKVRRSMEVPADFHPRFAQTEKTYEYRILNSSFPVPVRSRYTHFCYYKLDTEKMDRAAKYLVGEHDFASFCSVHAQVSDTVREVTGAEVFSEEHEGAFSEPWREIVIRVSGKGFLYNMVRIIAGTLIEVGRGALEPECVPEILEGRDRSLAGPTAPATGLCLTDYRILWIEFEYYNPVD
ncbi:MAG: tRNA pseudouridine(38-40) synthase TruA [Lachnospiraceae bacterium]|nr:tRNA pseudouridine(38-40) synthase TruA [Lachnospiraceae bacterium]